MESGARPKIFHGWKMVGAAFGLQFVLAVLMHQSFGAYVATLTREFGWSKTSLSVGAALQSLEAALLGPLMGWIVDRFGAQGMIRAGVVVFAAGFAMLASIDSLTGYYVAVITLALGGSFCGYFPLTVALVQWFEKKRARALSTMSLGLAVGGLFVPVVAGSIQTFGWRATALGSAVFTLLAGWPLARSFRRSPEEMGETIDGEPVAVASAASAASAATQASATPETPPAPAQEEREFTAREAIRTAAFWLLSAGHGFALLVVSAVNVHALTHMSAGLGYTLAQASVFITLMTLAQTGGVMLGWMVGDRVDKRKVSAACMLMHATGLLALTWATGPAMLVVFGVLHGTAWGLRGPFMQAIRADYFGRRAIGMILGISAAFIAIGQVSGPMLAGWLADVTGNYRTGFTALAVLAAAGSLTFLWAKKPPLPVRTAA